MPPFHSKPHCWNRHISFSKEARNFLQSKRLLNKACCFLARFGSGDSSALWSTHIDDGWYCDRWSIAPRGRAFANPNMPALHVSLPLSLRVECKFPAKLSWYKCLLERWLVKPFKYKRHKAFRWPRFLQV